MPEEEENGSKTKTQPQRNQRSPHKGKDAAGTFRADVEQAGKLYSLRFF